MYAHLLSIRQGGRHAHDAQRVVGCLCRSPPADAAGIAAATAAAIAATLLAASCQDGSYLKAVCMQQALLLAVLCISSIQLRLGHLPSIPAAQKAQSGLD
jgi:hypothetical protein